VNDLPERAGHRHMRVSDADRDRAAEVLREATGDGRLTFDELEERLTRTYAAKTYADLEEVTSDLPGTGTHPPVTASRAFPAARIGGQPAHKVAIAVMSGAQRTGQWVVPATFTAFALMGGVELDLREARFSEREVTIQAYSVMGGVSIVVGEDIEVDVSGIGCMGGFDDRATGPGVPGAPRLRVTGFALMGGVEVKRKPAPGRDKTAGPGQHPQISS
jgi:DUF1707 SHOCT-like domain